MKHLSPHVNIYKFPITAVSSITNRITGVALTGLFITSGLICNTSLKPIVEEQYNKLPKQVKGVVAFPFIYHTLGGVRHLIWDKYPNLLTISQVSKSSHILIGLSIGSSILYGFSDYSS